MLLQELPGLGGAPKFEYGELAAELTVEHAEEDPAATAERTMQLCLFSATFPFRMRARAKQLLRGRQVRQQTCATDEILTHSEFQKTCVSSREEGAIFTHSEFR